MLLSLSRLQKQPFIQDQNNRIGILGQNFLVRPIGARKFKFKEQIRKSDILCPVTLLAGFHTKGACQVCLAAAGRSGDKQIPVLCNILTGGEPLDQLSIELPPGCIIDVSDESLRLIKAGIANEAFEAVGLSVAVFDVDQHPEAVFEGNVLHPGIVHLCDECIRHGCQAHFNQFVNRALVRHDHLPPVVVPAAGDRVGVMGFNSIGFGLILIRFVLPGGKNVLHRLVAGARSV